MVDQVGIWSTVLGLAGLLMLAVLMLPAARRIAFPYTVLLAAVGVVLGLLEAFARELPVLGDFVTALSGLEITADAVFFVFLPALVFEAALALDVRRLLDDIGPILFLAVIGLLISTAVVGLGVWAVSGMALVVCLMLGAIVSATDPVAVVALFKEVGAPKRLSILVEGESLFNDATAIVLFSLLAGMITGTADTGALAGIGAFVQVFLGGILVGWILGRVVVAIIARLDDMPLVEQSLTISLAYLSFLVAEHYLHVSGVMAVVVAALVVGARGRSVIHPKDWHALHETWEQLGFWANSIIFILVGVAVPGILAGFGLREAQWLVVLVVAALAARALIIFGLLPLLAHWNLAQRVSTAFRAVMFWGGLRGAVSLALALMVIENPAFTAETQRFVGVLVTGFVLFTLFVNAPTIGVVIRFFGLDRLSATDAALRDRALALALDRIGDRIEVMAARQDASEATRQRIVETYRARSERAEAELEALKDLPRASWLQVGLTTLTARERAAYDAQFAAGFLSSGGYRAVAKVVDELSDGLRSHGAEGYVHAGRRALSFGSAFRLATDLHRRVGLLRPLARRISERFERLTSMKLALREVAHEGLPKTRELLDHTAAAEVERVLQERLAATVEALESLELQYPDYARQLEERLLERGALRLEEQSYRQMYADALITGEVYGDLESLVRRREREAEAMPRLDLGLEPRRLVERVPLFQGLPEQRLVEMADLLQPRLALPEEKVVTRGEQGDAMYFISSGSVRVEVEPEPVQLGTGDFFGELALITQQPRNADVVATSFAELLVLSTADFQRLMHADPEARRQIEREAGRRLESSV